MAGGWDVVETKPVSQWDVVSVAPLARANPDVPDDAGLAESRRTAAVSREANPEPGIGESVVGAVEGALNGLSKIFGAGPVGALGGIAGALKDVGGLISQGGAYRGNEAARLAAAGASDATYQPRTGAGQEMVEKIVDPALREAGAVVAGPRGVVGLSRTGGPPAARRVVGDAARSAGDVVLEAATPKMEPGRAALAQKAVGADIPLNLHQLTENKFARLIGEAAENIPYSGSKRKQRQQKFNNGITRAIDPESKATSLTPEVFEAAMEKAGETIGAVAERTPVPVETFGNLTEVARRETPDVQGVVGTYVADLLQMADEGGGVVSGTRLRKLRSEIGRQARSTPNGDLRRTLGDLTKRIDDAVTEHAPEADIAALADARRRYAIGSTVLPLVAKSANGDISPAALLGQVTRDNAGKQRMARGRGGELGEYARIGQQFLKEQATSNTAERNLVYRGLTDAVTAGKAATAYPFALAYNLLGPRVAKLILDRQAKRGAPTPDAPPRDPELIQGFEQPFNPAPPARDGGPGPLGDLTPEWDTQPGAGGAPRAGGIEPAGLVQAVDEGAPLPQGIPQRPGAQIPLAENRPLGDLTPDWDVGGAGAPRAGMDPAGLVRAVGEEPPLPQGVPARPGAEIPLAQDAPLGDLLPDWETSPGAGGAPRAGAEPGLVPALGDEVVTTGPAKDLRNGLQIPAVEGRPDLPDTMIGGPPSELAPDSATGAAMQSPNAALARQQQRPAPAPAPAAPTDPKLAEIDRLKAASTTPEVQKALDEVAKTVQADIEATAEKAKRAKAATELRRTADLTTDPTIAKALRERAAKLEEKVPVGKATEQTPAPPAPAPKPAKPIPKGEATELAVEVVEPPGDIPVGEAREVTPGKFLVGKVYTDGKGVRAVYRADGTWQEVP